MLSITFSCFIGVTSALTPTSALFSDADAVAGNSMTADCWRDFSKDGVKKREYHSCTDPHEKHDDHDSSGGVKTKSVDDTQPSDFAVLEDVAAPRTPPVLEGAAGPQPAAVGEQPAPVAPPGQQKAAPTTDEAPVVKEPVEPAPAVERTDTEGQNAAEAETTDGTTPETAP